MKIDRREQHKTTGATSKRERKIEGERERVSEV